MHSKTLPGMDPDKSTKGSSCGATSEFIGSVRACTVHGTQEPILVLRRKPTFQRLHDQPDHGPEPLGTIILSTWNPLPGLGHRRI